LPVEDDSPYVGLLKVGFLHGKRSDTPPKAPVGYGAES